MNTDIIPFFSFENYNCEEIYRILRDSFQKNGIIQHKSVFSEDVLEKIPILEMSRLLLRIIHENQDKKVKLTQEGYIPPNLIKQFHDSAVVKDFFPGIEYNEDTKNIGESRIISYLRDLMSSLRLIKVRKTNLSLTVKGRMLLKVPDLILPLLLKEVFVNSNYLNFPHYSATEIVYSVFSLFLILIDKYGENPVSSEFLIKKIIDFYGENIYKSNPDIEEAVIDEAVMIAAEHSLFHLGFRMFGLIEESDDLDSDKIWKTDIFDKLIMIIPPSNISSFEILKKFKPNPKIKEVTDDEEIPLMEDFGNLEFENNQEAMEFIKELDKFMNDNLDENNESDQSIKLTLDAMEASPEKAKKLLKKALKLDPTNVEAMLELLEFKNLKPGQLELELRKIIAVAKKNIGDDFNELAKDKAFWGFYETRPYMKAQFALMDFYISELEFSKAIDVIYHILDLNPNDNLGSRYNLASLLVAEERYDDYEKLLLDFPEESAATWLYVNAFYNFKKFGQTRKSTKAAIKAMKSNIFVKKIFSEEIKAVPDIMDFYKPGTIEEANNVILDLLPIFSDSIVFSEFVKFLNYLPEPAK